MNITESLKSQLIDDFKYIRKVEHLVSKYEIYKFNKYNITQLQKIFGIELSNIFKETNARKHFNKVLDIIKSNFYSDKTNNYLNIIFNPTSNNEKISKIRKSLELVKIDFDTNINTKKIKEIISSLENMNSRIVFNNSIITIDSVIEKILYDKFKIYANFMSKKELEVFVESDNFDPKTIIISDEDLYTEIPVYSLKEFEKLIKGNIIKSNEKQILKIIEFLEITKIINDDMIKSIEYLIGIKFDLNFDYMKLKKILTEKNEDVYKELTNKTLHLSQDVEDINKKIKEIISTKQLSLQGDELLKLLNSGDMTSLQKRFREDTYELVKSEEKKIIDMYKENGINVDFIFSNSDYPLTLDEEVSSEILNKIDSKTADIEFKLFEKLGEFNFSQIKDLWNYMYLFDLIFGIKKFEKKYNLKNIKISNEIIFINGKNIYLDFASPVNYAIGAMQIKDIKLKSEKVGILTGANSGGKTTLLEMNLQSQILTCIGLGSSMDDSSSIKLFDEVIYLKKFTGTVGSGAFEQTIRNLVDILDSNTSKFILIDEFEAVTEPGAAARILIMFLKEIIKQDSFCITASHLGQEIIEFIENEKIEGIRVDGISAKGLDEEGNLITNHQPEFYKLGKSTPELILKRIIMDDKFWKNKSDRAKKILENIVDNN